MEAGPSRTYPRGPSSGRQDGTPSDEGGYNSGPSQSSDPSHTLSTLSTSNFSLPDRQTLTKDGQPAKKRGPKPDSKPALTKRQQMNRQAQRSHRERKELYIKSLEKEVLRLKESSIQAVQEKDATAKENRRLMTILARHGINYETGASSSGSISGSYATGSDHSGFSPATNAHSMHQPTPQSQQMPNIARMSNPGLNYDQIGINFVLKLEEPCKNHMQYLEVRSLNPANQPFHHPAENADDGAHEHLSGHALMATCVPYTHVMERPAEPYPFQMPPGLTNEGLVTLLNLSARLPLDREGEVTPVMAWSWILHHERVGELDAQDLENITSLLATKVRCYGFGAVLEEFELHDVMNAVLANKDVPALVSGLTQHAITA